MMTPTKHRKKVPLQELRQNPFTSSRNAYPSLDQAFQTTPNCQTTSDCLSPERTSSSVEPSELDLSIGALAELYQHHRHIMKYGLDHDGQTHHQEEINSSTTFDDWEQLMDGNVSHASSSSTFMMESDPLSFLKIASYSSNRYHVDGSSSGGDVDEDMTLLSDYFNSSEVLKLFTPEKNRSKIDEASRLARLGFVGMANQNADQHDNTHDDCDESSMMDESGGMVRLFQAAMKIGLEESHDEIQEDEHTENEEERVASFISYQEPNLSVANLDGIETSSHSHPEEEDDNHDTFENCNVHSSSGFNHKSFISYRDPNLSVFSGRSGTVMESSVSHSDHHHSSNDCTGQESEFQSYFEENVIEIIETGTEFELSSMSPAVKRNVGNTLKSSGLPRSGFKFTPKSSLKTPIREKKASPMQSTINTPESSSSIRYKKHSSIRWSNEHSPPNLSKVSMRRLREVQSFYSSGKGPSPVKCIANRVNTEDIQLHCNPMHLKTNTLSLSPIERNSSSKIEEKKKNLDMIKSQSKTNCTSISNTKPKRLTLRDRYSRPERFEDNFSVPSSTSTLNSSPQSLSDDSPVNRSLLESFETASCTRIPRFEV